MTAVAQTREQVKLLFGQILKNIRLFIGAIQVSLGQNKATFHLHRKISRVPMGCIATGDFGCHSNQPKPPTLWLDIRIVKSLGSRPPFYKEGNLLSQTVKWCWIQSGRCKHVGSVVLKPAWVVPDSVWLCALHTRV